MYKRQEPDRTGFEGMDQLMLARNAAQLTYENAAGEGVDVEYTVLPGRVKEAIVLESPQDIVSYIMDITLSLIHICAKQAPSLVSYTLIFNGLYILGICI